MLFHLYFARVLLAFWLCLHLRFQAISLAFCSRLYLRLDMFSPAILIAFSEAILPFCFCVSTCIFASNFYAVVIAFIHRMIVCSPRLNKNALGDYALFNWIFKRGCQRILIVHLSSKIKPHFRSEIATVITHINEQYRMDKSRGVVGTFDQSYKRLCNRKLRL